MRIIYMSCHEESDVDKFPGLIFVTQIVCFENEQFIHDANILLTNATLHQIQFFPKFQKSSILSILHLNLFFDLLLDIKYLTPTNILFKSSRTEYLICTNSPTRH